MSKAVVCAFAVVIALVPVASDLCGFGCIKPAAASCPLHHDAPTTPETCKHDHTILGATVVRPLVAARPPATVAVVAVRLDDWHALQSPIRPSGVFQSPPAQSAQSVVLRI